MKVYSSFTLLIVVLLSACGTIKVSILETEPSAALLMQTTTPAAVTPIPQLREGQARVIYTKEGNVFVWDEVTSQSKTVFASGDVTRVAMSDDGQVIAFVRHSESRVALWAVDWNGRNPRELVSAKTFHERLETVEFESEPIGVGIGELEWIPGTHRLIYNGTFMIGSGHYFASRDIYLLDVDTLSETLVARDIVIDPVYQMNIVPSPDGQRLALITSTGLSFLNVDGSNPRNNILAYSPVGASSPPILMPTGIWTQDSSAFLTTGSLNMDEQLNLSFSIWRVPVDGSALEALTPILNGRPDSVTFSPDGKSVAFLENTGGSLIASLAGDAGPLAATYKFESDGYSNLHWSPAGDVFTKDLMQLCSGASRDTELCETPFNTHATGVLGVQWLDGQRALFLSNAPSVLFLSRLNSAPILIDFSGSFDGMLIEQE
jgi:Tol biopolymer transport system component